ncbi:MAG: SDR family NAD(P)-dependent oxidoreductase [Actinomycetota bacterium]|nr:MAG: SDR family NAD(P)-dependent oxidoreductase [Actinomycetota bacterium]
MRLDGQVAVITGGARGLGRAYAVHLASRGAAVVVNDLGTDLQGEGATSGPAEEAAEQIRSEGGRAVANGDDISDPAGAQRLVDQAIAEFGRLDIVVNNAGIGNEPPLGEIQLKDFERILRVHAGGHFNVTNSAWPHLAEQKYGRIVMTTSVSLFGAEIIAYPAAKGAILGMTRSFSLLGAPHGIKVNAINPGAFTRMAEAAFPVGHPRRAAQEAFSVELVAPLVGWLSHESCSVTGEAFDCRGGIVARMFLGLNDGVRDPQLSMESIDRNIDRIMDVTKFHIPTDNLDAKDWVVQAPEIS